MYPPVPKDVLGVTLVVVADHEHPERVPAFHDYREHCPFPQYHRHERLLGVWCGRIVVHHMAPAMCHRSRRTTLPGPICEEVFFLG